MLACGQLVADEAGEVVTRVEVRVAVVSFEVGAILRESAAISGDLVQIVRPSVGGLGAEMMSVRDSQAGLQRIVVGRADALNLVDVAVLRVLAKVGPGLLARQAAGINTGTRLVDIEQAEETPALRAYIADLQSAREPAKPGPPTRLPSKVKVPTARR